MAANIIHHTTITGMHAHLGFEPPTHPLITIIDMNRMANGPEEVGNKITNEFYSVALKDKGCGLDYGRNHYDFDEGALIFMAPGQVLTLTREVRLGQIDGWLLYFHPDLIRGTSLGERIDSYHFFSYDVHEALHLSRQEEDTINQCVDLLKTEISSRIDQHSQTVLASTLELILNHAKRFYERQFITRRPQNQDLLSKVERLLKNYYQAGLMEELGMPSIPYLAEQCNVSTYYLSDLLKKETGRTAKDHINDFLIHRAKHLLLGSQDSVSQIAYSLGFNYPHYFSRLFKAKTGMSPQEFRAA
ncbi:MAG: helix-turn-helix transcriptional regulator [Bacteroidota bacterium]